MEKIIHEVKVVETDDGYRIEIRGNKARLKEMFEHMPFGKGMPFGFGMFGPRHRGWGWGRGWKGGRRHRRRGPWEWDVDVEREEGGAPPPTSV